MIHGSVAAETAISRWMLGRAMFAMVSSSTSMSCAVAMTIKDKPSPRPPGGVPGWPLCTEDIGELLKAWGGISSVGLHRVGRADRQAECGERHPHRHGDHHQVLGERDEPEGDVARSADAGALELALVDVNGLEHRDRADRADEEGDRHRQP